MNSSNGISRITNAFEAARRDHLAALMPYFTFGYPDRATSLEIINTIASYSDLLELGIPFSDPIADGPSIQRSTQISLEKGTTTATCLQMLHELRLMGMDKPVMLMGYYNPILSYSVVDFVRDAASAGADGFIIPDLPPEEAGDLERAALEAGLALIYFLAPTSSAPRISSVADRARGFIYLVSLTGVTGARSRLQRDLGGFVNRVRKQTSLPLAVGFGISTPDQAAAVGEIADGVIVGSALIDAVKSASDKPAAAASFVASLKQSLSVQR